MKDVRRDIKCTCAVNVHENRVLTGCGFAGSDGQGVMRDVRRDIKCTCTVKYIRK